MPTEKFYEGLLVPEAVRKLADHHYHPRNRHISAFEYQLLERAADRLSTPRPRRPGRAEVRAGWDRLLQAYWTGIAAPAGDAALDVWTIPGRILRSNPELEDALDPADPSEVVPATVWSAQALFGALLSSGVQTDDSVAAAWKRLMALPAEIERYLTPVEFELVNRALYQPAVAMEGSPPEFKPIKEIVEQASAGAVGGYVWLTGPAHEGPVGVLKVAGTIIVVRAAMAVADRLSDFIHTWKR